MKIRIAKFIADSGAASRRAAEDLISQGRVSVNGETITGPVCFVDQNDTVIVNGKKITRDTNTDIYAFYKPINTVTTRHDPDGRATIYDIIPDEYKNLKYIGRLDYKTTGLLLLTNNGEIARKLTLPSSGISRTYIATVARADEKKLNRARAGVTVDGIKYRPMKIKQISDNVLRVTVTEGKKNEVRIVLRACGSPVKKLHRVSFGNIELGNLSVGEIRKISQKTIDEMLKSL